MFPEIYSQTNSNHLANRKKIMTVSVLYFIIGVLFLVYGIYFGLFNRSHHKCFQKQQQFANFQWKKDLINATNTVEN